MTELPLPDFVKDRDWADAWLYAVLADSDITLGTKAVASLLRLRWNAHTATSSPSIDGMAAGSCQNRRTIQNQRESLKARGLLFWIEKKGRVRCEYFLGITSAVERMLVATNPRRAAELGIVKHPHPGQLTSAQNSPILRRVADQTLKPVKPLRGAVPRAPDGAAVAARLGEAGQKLLGRLGPTKLAAWFDDVIIDDNILFVPNQMKANRFLGTMRLDLDASMKIGWRVIVRSQAAITDAVNEGWPR